MNPLSLGATQTSEVTVVLCNTSFTTRSRAKLTAKPWDSVPAQSPESEVGAFRFYPMIRGVVKSVEIGVV